ncbi:MAG: universal stress protein [Thermoleophilia bacterium]|nr:universal stress protein [Thermoleophilia bacterium]
MGASFAHIGCLIDGPSCGVTALGTAISLWRASAGRLSLIHVGAPPEPGALDVAAVLRRDDPGAAAREQLRATARGIPGAEAVCLNGPAADAVGAWAAGAGIDLLVVGSGTGDPPRAGRARLVHDLAGHAPCPVLVVRPALSRAPGELRAAGAAAPG